MATNYANIGFHRASGNQLELLTYAIPENLSEKIKEGDLVKVPFLRGEKHGIIFSKHKNPPSFVTKDIIEVLSDHPLLQKWQLELIAWMAEYYFCSVHTVLKHFIPESLFKNKKTRNTKAKTTENPHKASRPKEFTQAQEKAFSKIINSANQHFLLHGVTGAGKSEIYLQLAKSIKEKEQFLLLVPEISLTPQLIEYFEQGLGKKVASINSRLTPAQKRKIWEKVQEGEINIVIGSRSAIFAPFSKLKYIVIDEEQEWSYKQDQSPRYHTKEVAEKMLSLLPFCKLILGSATPSIESYWQAVDQKKYELLELPDRINIGSGKNELPEVSIIDLREELQKKNYSMFSDLLQDKMAEKLAKKEQIILFLNRRGSSSSILCRDCGETMKCKHCDVSLTYHSTKYADAKLICHYCGVIEKVPNTCPNCSSTRIKFIGVGTQKVEGEIRKLFPEARVHRADKDTTSKKDSFKELYQKLRDHEIDILIGTQMIGKGLHLPKVNLVGVIIADIGLHIPDFRSSEKTFQLLTQVAGRAGRVNKGEVIIQTYLPEHPAIHFAKDHDYKNFYAQEIKYRKELEYPPYKEIIRLLISDKDKTACKKEHNRVLELIQKEAEEKSTNCHKDLEIMAHPAFIERIHNKYRYIITLKGNSSAKLVQKILPELNKWKVDRNPYWG